MKEIIVFIGKFITYTILMSLVITPLILDIEFETNVQLWKAYIAMGIIACGALISLFVLERKWKLLSILSDIHDQEK